MRWYLRRTGSIAGGGGKQHLQVLETRSLGPNRSLQLVRVGERAVLVGVTQERVSSLLQIEDPDEVERLATPATPERAQPGTLASMVTGMLGGAGSLLSAPARLRDRRRIAAHGSLVEQHQAYRGMRVADAQQAMSGDAAFTDGWDGVSR